jgi:hypothetical protein
MSYIAKSPETYKDQVVGTGHCVPFVQVASGAPPTALWTKGELVKGNSNVKAVTAIATFGDQGRYTNSLDGTSHAAIYVRQDAVGIQVWDQWLGQPVHQRVIRFQGGAAGTTPVNDGDFYYVIE